MVHDLTANGDFTSRRSFGVLGRLLEDMGRINSRNNDLTLPYDELVLTGTTSDRDSKRYVLDYESGCKNKCDCCGSIINMIPWDFEENKTLCVKCEKWLEETHNSRDGGELLQKVVDNTWRVRVIKPWDMNNFERENAIDNVLLWD